MINKIILSGIINNIEYSHTINDVDYDKATMLVKRNDNKEDLLNIKFKRFSNPYRNGQEVSLQGNIRTFSQRLGDRNKVEVYTFTYFDIPAEDSNNEVEIEGRICKLGELRKTQAGKDVIDFIIANNIESDSQSLNCYIPCVAWGKVAKICNKLQVSDKVILKGQLQSREYKKKISDNDFELRVAHELCVHEIEELNET